MKLAILILVVMSPMLSMAQRGMMYGGNYREISPSLMDVHKTERADVGEGRLTFSFDLISQAQGFNDQKNCRSFHASANVRENLGGPYCTTSQAKAMQLAAKSWTSEKSIAPSWPFSYKSSYGHYANMLLANKKIGCHACKTTNGCSGCSSCILVRCLYN